jgi:membrane protein
MLSYLADLRRALLRSLGHDVLTTAKAAAYSAILSVFPALLVLTTLLALTPETSSMGGEIRSAFEQILPSDTMDLVQSYFQNQHTRSVKALWSSSIISLFAAMGVMLSLMEGFRRAYQLPRGQWRFIRQQSMAVVLIFICLVPMAFASMLVAFGHLIETWMIDNSERALRYYVLYLWRLVRWAIALLTSVSVLEVIYYFGTPRVHTWKRFLPGAAIATLFWFISTLAFGWYVVRFTDYSMIYGPLGAAVATLIWLYLTSLAVLFGAEFNAQIHRSATQQESDELTSVSLAAADSAQENCEPQFNSSE